MKRRNLPLTLTPNSLYCRKAKEQKNTTVAEGAVGRMEGNLISVFKQTTILSQAHHKSIKNYFKFSLNILWNM